MIATRKCTKRWRPRRRYSGKRTPFKSGHRIGDIAGQINAHASDYEIDLIVSAWHGYGALNALIDIGAEPMIVDKPCVHNWPIVLEKSEGTILWSIIGAQSYALRIDLSEINGIASFNEAITADSGPFWLPLLQFRS